MRVVARGRSSVLGQLIVGTALAATGLFASPASAQTRTYMLDRAQISGAPDDGFMVYRPYVGDETRFYANAALGFSLNPLRDDHVHSELDLDGPAPIVGQFPVYLSAGLQIEGIVGLNLHIPFTPYQITGTEPPIEFTGQGGLTDTHATMNDIRFDARLMGWESNNRKTRFGGFGAFTIATGSPYGFGGDRQATAMLAVSGEHDFGPFMLTGHVGPHFKPARSLDVESDLMVGRELRYAFGAFMPLRDNKVRLGVELWGSAGLGNVLGTNTTFKGRNTTLEWLAQARFLVSEDEHSYLNVGGGTRLSNGYGSADVRVLVSIGRYWGFKDEEPDSPPGKVHVVDSARHHDLDTDGDGYPDEIDACPEVKEDGKKPDPTDGCPAPADNDRDGIIDVEDKCPNEPEDFDGIADEDGCPEEDFDNDKIKDEVDACPEEPGPANRNADKNGCPTTIKLGADGSVDLLKPIQFANGRSTIKRVSYPIIDEVATLLKARPNIKISVHGHTDNVGSHDNNVKLSDLRAAAVRKRLIKLGIDASRLDSKGFGPDKPLVGNSTAEGRAKNRRVEFVVKSDAASDDAAWE